MSGMDTLEATRELRDAGIQEKQAEAITRVIKGYGRADLVTKDYLDMRLAQMTMQITVMVAGINIAIAGLFMGIAKLIF